MDIVSNFGENLYDLICDNQLTPRTFSEKANVDCSLVYKYLRKEMMLTLPNLVLICDLLSCSADYILGLAVENPKINYKQALPFCTRFQTVLRESGLTRYKFLQETRRSGFHFAQQSVDDWFHGKRLPTVDNAVALAGFFDCTLDYLLGRDI